MPKSEKLNRIRAKTIKTCFLAADQICARDISSDDISSRNLMAENAGITNATIINENVTNSTIANLNVTGTIKLPLAPPVVTVNPNLTPNGITIFSKIQDALDFLSTQQFSPEGVVVNIAGTLSNPPFTGVYQENIVITQQDSSDATTFKLIGDSRPIVGVGIANNSFWNATATPSVPVGGGKNSVAVLQAIAGTNTITLTNSGIAPSINPDFTAPGGVVPGDTVVLRSDSGIFNPYTVTAVAPTQLTVIPAIVNTVGATATTLGGAMVVAPNVTIAPTAGTVITQESQVTLQGLNIIPAADANGIDSLQDSVTQIQNVFVNGGAVGILSTSAAQSDDPTAFIYSNSSFGFTLFNQTVNAVLLVGSMIEPEGVLAAGTGFFIQNSRIFTRQFGIRTIANWIVSGGAYLFFSGQGAGVTNNVDIISPSGTAMLVASGSFIDVTGTDGGVAQLLIRGAPSTGISLSRSTLQTAFNAYVSLLSTAATFVGYALGGTAGDGASATSVIGNVLMPNSAGSIMARVRDGSTFGFTGFATGTTRTFGAAANAFQVLTGSTLIYRGSNTTGNITGGGGTGICFDIQGNSTLVMPSTAANRTFSGFKTVFNFDDNSSGNIFNATAQPDATGTAVIAQNLSTVELDTVTLGNGTGTFGIQTAFGARVGKKGTSAVSFAAGTTSFAPGSGVQSTTDQIGNYTATYNSGLITVT